MHWHTLVLSERHHRGLRGIDVLRNRLKPILAALSDWCTRDTVVEDRRISQEKDFSIRCQSMNLLQNFQKCNLKLENVRVNELFERLPRVARVRYIFAAALIRVRAGRPMNNATIEHPREPDIISAEGESDKGGRLVEVALGQLCGFPKASVGQDSIGYCSRACDLSE